MKYTVPTSGTYHVSSTIATHVPTGEMEWIKNPRRRWFQFWKPKMIERAAYRVEHSLGGMRIVQLKAGDTVDLKP